MALAHAERLASVLRAASEVSDARLSEVNDACLW
jgi:hypothetical protein